MSKLSVKTKSVSKLRDEALLLLSEVESLHGEVCTLLDASLDRAWRLGRCLNRIKAEIRAGDWLLWLETNLPRLSSRNAQRAMLLDQHNPKARSIRDLSPDSVRQFRLGYVPAKERSELEGDVKLNRSPHHLSIVNDWRKFHRRVEVGLAKLDHEEARRDLRPVFDWMCHLYGVDSSALVHNGQHLPKDGSDHSGREVGRKTP